jgi:hypothetical protein
MGERTRYVVRYQGRVVGTRTSAREYRFAAVCQVSEIEAREAAYQYKPGDTVRDHYERYAFMARQAPGSVVTLPGSRQPVTLGADEIENAKAMAGGGFDGYIAFLRSSAINAFEVARAAGRFEPFVCGWSKTREGAQRLGKAPGAKLLAIVEVSTNGAGAAGCSIA